MKYIGLLFLGLMITMPSFARWGTNCTNNGGTIIKANEYGNDQGNLCNNPNDANSTNNCNGLEFCMSGQNMNWWSAFTWCESIGGVLARFDHLCPNTQMIKHGTQPGSGACPNLKGVGPNAWGWSSTGIDNCQAFDVNVSTGAVANFRDNCWDVSRSSALRALCE